MAADCLHRKSPGRSVFAYLFDSHDVTGFRNWSFSFRAWCFHPRRRKYGRAGDYDIAVGQRRLLPLSVVPRFYKDFG